ncbi:MAG: 16S rRNA (cytidine(1402)-2'-O)-methyltransferase [Clostridiales bacterium]|nr:16S rRNA (cytidine(1402)-2'-O)-methyltransferase [Clostridiales bacterium]
MSGILYLVSTPIGNLEDITLRAVRVLREADLIAAEDTRKSARLLSHLGVKKPLLSYYRHNQKKRDSQILPLLQAGKNIALISDAGTPAVSDPGAELVAQAVQAGVKVVAVPGPSALLAALVTSGLDTARFCFEGFLPRGKAARRKALAALADEPRTMIFYEAPHRLLPMLEDLREVFGDRRLVVGRELTKLFEETLRGTAEELLAHFRAHEPRGEFVLMAEGASQKPLSVPDDELLAAELRELLHDGLPRREAARLLGEKYALPSKKIYALGLEREDD